LHVRRIQKSAALGDAIPGIYRPRCHAA
jgi:hypothetical protein